MTTVHHAATTAGGGGDPQLVADLDDLRRALGDHPFPTQQDDLIASCIAHSEPARLAGRLALLSRTHTYTSLDEVCAHVEDAVRTS